MRSQVRLKLAETLRAGLDEFAERWVKFIRANDLAPETNEPEDEAINRARLGFEVLANLLEGGEYAKFENVIRRLLHDWVNSAASYADLLAIEDSFPVFIMPHLEIDSESDEGDEFLFAINEFFQSDLRAEVLSLYLQVYEEIISLESRHTAYILGHFDAILSLTAHLNGAGTREDILIGLAPVLRGLFENVHAVAIWTESSEGLAIKSVEVMGDEIPTAVLEKTAPERLEEIFNIGESRWISEDELEPGFKTILGVEIQSALYGCVIPIRPREADGLLVMLLVGIENPGSLELSLSRVASAECALAFDRVNSQERIRNINRRINDILSLSRETSWGSCYRETGELVLDYLLDLTGGGRAILLAAPASGTGGSNPVPLAWRDLPEDDIDKYRRASKLPPIVSIAVKSGKTVLVDSFKLAEILSGKEPPCGFEPSENQAMGILPLEMSETDRGICLFLCPKAFASAPESQDILAVFAKTAADSLAAAREYERSLRIESITEADANRARVLQQKLTPRYRRSGNLVYWAHLQPAGELAGDVLVVKSPEEGHLNVWAADVAGRGASVAWSMIFIRQLLAELPPDIPSPVKALSEINESLHEIETVTSPGIFATLIGLVLDESSGTGRFSRAGAPRLYKISVTGDIETIDPDGLPLGLFADAQLEEIEFTFKPGDKLVWASDGLLGIRDESGQVWGESGLIDCIKKVHFIPARALFEHILATLGEFAADDMARDDWSLVVIGHDPEHGWAKSMPGRDRDQLLKDALSWLKTENLKPGDFIAIRMLLDEAIKNAHEHGNYLDDDALIEIKIICSQKHIHIRVRDEGGKLNERVTSPDLRPERILEDKGRGFLLMRHQSDHLWVDEARGELNAVRFLEDPA